MDMSTAEQMVKNGKLTDWTFKQSRPEMPLPYGENKSTINAGFSKTILIMLNYMLTDMVNEDRLEEMFYDELELHKVEKIIASCRGEDVEMIDWAEMENSPQEISDAIGSGQQKINSFDK
jgi:hypothetical protein